MTTRVADGTTVHTYSLNQSSGGALHDPSSLAGRGMVVVAAGRVRLGRGAVTRLAREDAHPTP